LIVVLTEEAEGALESIGDYIALDNPGQAITFLEEIVERCEQLAEMPHAYPLVPRYEYSGVRRRVVGEYLIFYRIGTEQIEILHILNGARNYETILFPER
jgi:toxin ParE1/3/4